jgi:thiosulfate/3-mercaptopyruvate sulfurtransferase
LKLAHPEWIASTEWLEAHLDDPGMRILDATVHLDRALEEEDRARRGYETAHVPGAIFVDHVEDLSDPDNAVPYARLAPDALAAAFAKAGVSDDSSVVVYSATHVMWATRVLWLLHGIGFDRVAVLDGGLTKWKEEGRPVGTGAGSSPLS